MPNPKTALQTGLDTPNAKDEYAVTSADLPIYCPMPGSSLWNSHPRVYIPVAEAGRAKCPYCGAQYYLVEGERG